MQVRGDCMAIVEAAAAGLMVVSTAVGGVPEVGMNLLQAVSWQCNMMHRLAKIASSTAEQHCWPPYT